MGELHPIKSTAAVSNTHTMYGNFNINSVINAFHRNIARCFRSNISTAIALLSMHRQINAIQLQLIDRFCILLVT